MNRVATAIAWLLVGVAIGAAAYSALKRTFNVASEFVLVVVSAPAFIAWCLDSYKKTLEIRKLHLEIRKLKRESDRDREAASLVQRVPSDLPPGFRPIYGERDRIYEAITEKERLEVRFRIDDAQ